MNMNLLTYNPTTPSLRFKCLVNKSLLWSGKKIKQLNLNIKHTSGRNKNGHLILYTKSKNYFHKIYRTINFNYSNFGIPYRIHRIEYDPNRSAFINLIYYFNNLAGYFLNINTVLVGDSKFSFLTNASNVFLTKGDSGLLKIIPENTVISLIEKTPTFGAIYTRSAGTYSILIQKHLNLGKALVKLKSGLIKMISLSSKATIGVISNLLHKQEISGKAGRSRWFGIKPNVRGVAMNPVDHPHGGGQGKKSKKPSPRTSWGKMYKWKKTSTYYTSKTI